MNGRKPNILKVQRYILKNHEYAIDLSIHNKLVIFFIHNFKEHEINFGCINCKLSFIFLIC